MSASVLSRGYSDSSGLPSGATTPRSAGIKTIQTPLTPSQSSLRSGDKIRQLGMPGAGLRISFASDTTFIERKLRSRGSSKSTATTFNLRPVQGGEKPLQSRVRLPKATNSTSTRYISTSHDEGMNPRKAMDIARSYGVPKYFLRGNSQILTDGRMRLFGDNVWKKERTTPDVERSSIDSSDVIHRLIDSVDKAIAISEKGTSSNVDDNGIKLEVISLKSGTDERASLRDSIVSFPDVVNPSRTAPDDERDGAEEKRSSVVSARTEERAEGHTAASFDSIRPHTVDTISNVPKHLPRVSFRNPNFGGNQESWRIPEETNETSSSIPKTPHLTGVRLHQLAAPFRGVSASVSASEKTNFFDEKYQHILPRFYPAVSAHKNRQAEAEKSARLKKKSGQQRLVRFADTHTVRFSNEVTHQEPLSGVVARRAPVQSVQRSLDSHSGLSQSEKLRAKLKEISDHNRVKSLSSLNGTPLKEMSKTPELKAYMYKVDSSYVTGPE